MTYALVTSSTIQAESGRVPNAARRLDTQQWVLGLPDASVALQQACGWFAVTDTPRPAETPTTTHDRTVQLVANVPTVVWTSRPKTPDELAADTATANDATIRTQATTALDTNRTFIALASPTQAQTLAQVKALSRQMNGLIRLQLGQLDGID